MHGWMSIRMRRCADARVHGCTDKRRRCDHAERQRESLKNMCFLVFLVRGRPSARSKFLGVPRANSAPSAKGKVLKNLLKTYGFLKFSARGPPSARSKFLGVPRANSANAREQIFESIPWLPPWGVQRRSERELRKRAKMESTKKTNCYYKNNYRIQSFIISCIQADRKKKIWLEMSSPSA